MGKFKKFRCSACCEDEGGSPCVLSVRGNEINFDPHNCPFDRDFDPKWELVEDKK